MSTPEGKRQRQATANRILTILKAALNQAYHDGLVAHDDAWRRVKAFRGVDAARVQYLSDEECRRLVNACAPDFRRLVIAGLMTGCRYSELVALTVDDFNGDVGQLRIRFSKTGKSRHVALAEEGMKFFRRETAGRLAADPIFKREDGRTGKRVEQQRPFVAACKIALLQNIRFHGLRHTYASRLIMKGAPLPVIAHQLGHSDTRMVEKHYGHLAPSYVEETVRATFGPIGVDLSINVIPLKNGSRR